MGTQDVSEDSILTLVRASHTRMVSDPRWADYGVAPATERAIGAAEQELGFPLPRVLCRVYAEIANGILTPTYHTIAGVRGGLLLEDDSAIDRYLSWRGEPPEGFEHWKWPVGMLPVSHEGCGSYVCIDCGTSAGRVFSFRAPDYTPDKAIEEVLVPSGLTVLEWLAEMCERESAHGRAAPG